MLDVSDMPYNKFSHKTKIIFSFLLQRNKGGQKKVGHALMFKWCVQWLHSLGNLLNLYIQCHFTDAHHPNGQRMFSYTIR